jgi:hypothetical protein
MRTRTTRNTFLRSILAVAPRGRTGATAGTAATSGRSLSCLRPSSNKTAIVSRNSANTRRAGMAPQLLAERVNSRRRCKPSARGCTGSKSTRGLNPKLTLRTVRSLRLFTMMMMKRRQLQATTCRTTLRRRPRRNRDVLMQRARQLMSRSLRTRYKRGGCSGLVLYRFVVFKY